MKEQAALAHETPGFLANIMMQQQATDTVDDEVETRFGRVRLAGEQLVNFRKGLLGMPEMTRFAVTAMPAGRWQQFRLLHSLDDATLSIIALPIDLDNPVIARSDLEEAASDLGIAPAKLQVMLVISVHREGAAVRLSANARAPLFLNAEDKSAEQYVLKNTRYMVRHMISQSK